jgi:transposase
MEELDVLKSEFPPLVSARCGLIYFKLPGEIRISLEGSVHLGVVRAVLKVYAHDRGLARTWIWIAAGVTDLQRGLHGMTAQVQTTLEYQPLSGLVFGFGGRRGDTGKVLWFDGDRLCLLVERLQRGRFGVALSEQRHGLCQPSAVVDVARRDRLEGTILDGRTGAECLGLSPIIHRA